MRKEYLVESSDNQGRTRHQHKCTKSTPLKLPTGVVDRGDLRLGPNVHRGRSGVTSTARFFCLFQAGGAAKNISRVFQARLSNSRSIATEGVRRTGVIR